MIKPFTQEQVSQKVAELGPLENVVLLGKETDDQGGIVVWYPEVGWRETIYEIDGFSAAMYRILRLAGANRYDSWEQMREDKATERMPGWNTSADYLRLQRSLEELAAENDPL